MRPPPTRSGQDPARARVLATLVGAAVGIGLLAGLDPTTLRSGGWTTAYYAALAVGALLAVALLTLGRRWPDALLGASVSGLMGLVVLSVLANQSRAGGMLNVVLLLPCAVFAAVHLPRRTCRAVMAALSVCVAVTMAAVAASTLQWITLVALPLLAFLGTTEVVLRLRSDLGAALHDLQEQSLTDALTGVSNRRALQERFAAGPGAASPAVLSVAVLDIDHFKAVNDRFGHAVGDEVLRRFGAGLRRETREEDVVVRMGGEEFLVLSATPPGRAAEFAETLRTRAALWMEEWSVTVSVGVVTVSRPDHRGLTGVELEAAVQAADACLYAAKEGGRDRVVLAVWADAPPVDRTPVDRPALPDGR